MRSLLLLLLSLTAVAAVKVKRVKAGMQYKKHDPVHVVVNKVGCVPACLPAFYLFFHR